MNYVNERLGQDWGFWDAGIENNGGNKMYC